MEESLSWDPGSAESKVQALCPLEVLNVVWQGVGLVLDCPLVKNR